MCKKKGTIYVWVDGLSIVHNKNNSGESYISYSQTDLTNVFVFLLTMRGYFILKSNLPWDKEKSTDRTLKIWLCFYSNVREHNNNIIHLICTIFCCYHHPAFIG